MPTGNPARKSHLILFVIIFAALIIFALATHHHRRHKHQAKLIKTKDHKIYVENSDGSCYTFVDRSGGTDVDLPRTGSTSFRLPSGSWAKTSPPREEEVEEEEEAEVEESASGEPEADADGDIGADSDSADSGDSGDGGDSGGDSGGDGGGDD